MTLVGLLAEAEMFVGNDSGASDRERALAERLHECGRCVNALLIALNNAAVVDDLP